MMAKADKRMRNEKKKTEFKVGETMWTVERVQRSAKRVKGAQNIADAGKHRLRVTFAPTDILQMHQRPLGLFTLHPSQSPSLLRIPPLHSCPKDLRRSGRRQLIRVLQLSHMAITCGLSGTGTARLNSPLCIDGLMI